MSYQRSKLNFKNLAINSVLPARILWLETLNLMTLWQNFAVLIYIYSWIDIGSCLLESAFNFVKTSAIYITCNHPLFKVHITRFIFVNNVSFHIVQLWVHECCSTCQRVLYTGGGRVLQLTANVWRGNEISLS